MGSKWIVPPTVAFQGLFTAYEWRIYKAVFKVLQARAPEIQKWMKENRPWTDRTGNARASLSADAIAQFERIIIELSLGRLPDGTILEYGKYLEWAHGGQYAIVGPAVDHWSPIIMEDMRLLLR